MVGEEGVFEPLQPVIVIIVIANTKRSPVQNAAFMFISV
jgi:hypothetical protein